MSLKLSVSLIDLVPIMILVEYCDADISLVVTNDITKSCVPQLRTSLNLRGLKKLVKSNNKQECQFYTYVYFKRISEE